MRRAIVMPRLLLPLSLLSVLSIGAIFGFFYAWVCSTMWGLDQTDPRVAITAMQAMNASVRNPVFFPAFFLTPALLAVTCVLAAKQDKTRSASLFAASAALYGLGAFLVTALVNVPMNEALAQIDARIDRQAADEIWQAYSPRWQIWNTVRTIASGGALLLAGLALHSLNPETS
jgi:uncharacterized membrane protein